MTEQASRRTIGRHGEDVTVRNYDHGNEDAHGDAERVETANSPYAAQGRVASTTTPQEHRDMGRTRLDADATVYLRDDFGGLNGLNGVGADSPPSRIERDATGETYRVVRAFSQGNGVLAADVEVVA